MSQQSFHKIIFKNTGLFGFSQLVKIAVKLVANKVVAIFLGTAGIGMIGLLENIIGLIQSTTNLGVASSSVREIAIISEGESKQSNKEKRLLTIVYQWAIATGILGTLIAVVFSNYISWEVFGSRNYTLSIIGFAFYFLLSSISSIRLSVLQARKEVSKIVIFHIITSIVTAFLAISLYYYYKEDGILPVFFCSILFQFIFSLYLTRNIKTSTEKISFKQIFLEGLPMVKLGILLSLSAIFGQICFYIIRWYLKENYSFDTLGIYQVGNTVLVGYLGLVFSAMATDYYPRLCNYENDSKQFVKLINDQTEVALLLVLPAILGLYLIAPFLIELLYSKDFLDVLLVLKFGLFAIVLKAIVWPLGFIPLIKNNKLLYFKQNLLGDGINVIASIVLFYYFSFLGLGIAYAIMFLVSLFYNFYTAKKYYGFQFRKDTLQIIGFSIIIGALSIVTLFFTEFKNFNLLILLWFLISLGFTIKHLKTKLFKK